QVVVFHGDTDRRGENALHFTLRSLHTDIGALDFHLNAAWNFDRQSSNSRHHSPPAFYQTLHRISPPTPSCRARAPVITPLGVDRIATPRPDNTQGMSILRV